MQLLGYNKIDGQPTATIESVEDVTSRTLIPSTNGFTTVTSLTTTVDAQKTGDYLLSFGAVGTGTSTGSVRMRFLVDGVPAATSTSGSNLGADSVAGVSASLGWIPFNLNQKLTLSPGTHTIAVQLSVDAGTLELAQRYLQLTGFNSALNPVMRTVPYSDESLANVSVSRRITLL